MPIYTHKCLECNAEFDIACRISERKDPHECESCGAENSVLVIKPCGINFPGDDWTTKNLRVQRQMRRKNEKLQKTSADRAAEQPVASLVPNVEGEQTGSWEDAQKLAKDKGKNTSSYDPMVQNERKVKSA